MDAKPAKKSKKQRTSGAASSSSPGPSAATPAASATTPAAATPVAAPPSPAVATAGEGGAATGVAAAGVVAEAAGVAADGPGDDDDAAPEVRCFLLFLAGLASMLSRVALLRLWRWAVLLPRLDESQSEQCRLITRCSSFAVA